MLEFKIPESLKILPNDSMEERNRKKKKLKHLKQGYKTSMVDREMQDKRSKWSTFNEQSKAQAKGHFYAKKNVESIFKTPDAAGSRVGFMNSGRGMTDFGAKERYDRKFQGDAD